MAIGKGQSTLERADATTRISLDHLAKGLNVPVFATSASDGSNRLFIVELRGTIRIYGNRQFHPVPFLDIQDRVEIGRGEQGFYSIAFHPQYKNNGKLFAFYTSKPNGDIIVSEFTVTRDSNIVDQNSERVLLRVPTDEPFHFGGQLDFGPDGYLYIGLGTGQANLEYLQNSTSQDMSNLLGKVLRIDVNQKEADRPYSVPKDNPYTNQIGYKDEIYASGFRNPWKFSFDSHGRLFLTDVGESISEEINLITKGANYGWPFLEANLCFQEPINGTFPFDECKEPNEFSKPIGYYGHAVRDPKGGEAITGGYVYEGNNFPSLKGRYIFGDFVSGRIWSLSESQPNHWLMEELLDTELSISSFAKDESGELYVLDITGNLYQILSLK